METQEVLEYLAKQPRVWIRLAAIRLDGGWNLALLEVTTGEAPADWHRERWNYEQAVFVALERAGTTVVRWLERERVSFPSLSIPIAVEGSFVVDRRDSNFQGIYEQLPWPTREWSFRFHDSSGQALHGELVAAGAPAFISFDLACAEFFGVPSKPNRNFSGRELVIRNQDRRARIDRVRIHPAHLVVNVSGEQRRGTTLTVSGAQGTARRLSSRSRQVRLPTPRGLGVGALLALHHDGELLDRRILDPTWGGNAEDVEVVLDSSTRIELMISGGEQATIEFKRELPEKDPVGFLKTVAAFANGAGGTILFGVANDGEIVGIGNDRTRSNRDRLTNLITARVRPLPHFDAEWVDVSGSGVIALRVAAGDQVPYGVGTDERSVRFYIRRAGSTFPASPTDVRLLVQSHIASPAAAPYLPRRRR